MKGRLTYNFRITSLPRRELLLARNPWSPSDLSRERLLVGGKQAFGSDKIDAGAKRARHEFHGRALFLGSNPIYFKTNSTSSTSLSPILVTVVSID